MGSEVTPSNLVRSERANYKKNSLPCMEEFPQGSFKSGSVQLPGYDLWSIILLNPVTRPMLY